MGIYTGLTMSFPAPPSSAPPPQPPPFRLVVPERRPLGAAKAMLVFIVYLLSQGVAGAVTVLMFGLTNGMESIQALEDLDPVLFLVAGVAGFVVGGPAVVLVTRALQPAPTMKEAFAPLGWVKVKPALMLKGAALGVGMALVFGYAVEAVFPPGDTPEGPLIQAASAPGWQRIVFVVLAVILAPVVEEFLFRGVMFTGMTRSWGKWPAAVVVTLLFGLLHIADIAGYWPALGVITLVGLVMLLLRIRTGSLVPSMAMHAAYNGVQVAALYLTL